MCQFSIIHICELNFCPKCCQKCFIKFNFNISNVWCQIVLVPNCPVPNCPGAKLSWCQIVHFYYLGAKLSAFIILVPNCPLYYLGAKLSGAKLSGAKLSGAKLSYNPWNLSRASLATPVENIIGPWWNCQEFKQESTLSVYLSRKLHKADNWFKIGEQDILHFQFLAKNLRGFLV